MTRLTLYAVADCLGIIDFTVRERRREAISAYRDELLIPTAWNELKKLGYRTVKLECTVTK